MDRADIVLLAAPGPITNIAYNALAARFGAPLVIEENPISRLALLKGRRKRLGLAATLSQVSFLALARPILAAAGRDAIDRRCAQMRLDRKPAPADQIVRVPSVNSPECRAALAAANPRLIVVNGTRILSRPTLAALKCQAINTHLGITPRYRGAHGGYWALWNGEPEQFGATVHLVDAGIDTGAVLAQVRALPGPDDNFASYAYLQLGSALPALLDTVEKGLAGPLTGASPPGPSGLWHHPGLGQYLWGRWRGVR